jgi:Protein of unknown function (DUF2793)
MAISLGPKLQLLFNSLIGEQYYDSLRIFLQALDQLVQMSVLSTAVISPPSTPNPGDAYLLLTGTPSGAWTGYFGYIAVWDTQVTTSGTNTTVPQWVFYKPNPGWITWVVSSSSLLIFNGVTWSPLLSGNIISETPVGAINGSNITFLIGNSPSPASSLQLYVNGVFQIPSTNYNINGTVITLNVAPSTGSTVYAVYQYV